MSSYLFSQKVPASEEFFKAIEEYLKEEGAIPLEYVEFESGDRIFRIPVSEIDKLENLKDDLFLPINPLEDQILQFEMSMKLEEDLKSVQWKSPLLVDKSPYEGLPSHMDWVNKLPPELRTVYDLNQEKIGFVRELHSACAEEIDRLSKLLKECDNNTSAYIKIINILHDTTKE